LNVIRWVPFHLAEIVSFKQVLYGRCEVTVNDGMLYLNSELVKELVYSYRLVV